MRKLLLLTLPVLLMSCNMMRMDASHEHHVLPQASISAVPSASVLKWSSPATWGGTLPVAGDTVTIPAGTQVLLDISPPALRGVQVNGTLSFDPMASITLQTDYLMVNGTLQAGTETTPVQGKAEIVLTSNNLSDNIMNMGAKALGVMGTLDLHGSPTAYSWTRLSQTVVNGSNTITVQDPVNWKVGDEIIITSSSFYNPYWPQPQTEQRKIVQISGRTLTLDRAVSFTHMGTEADGVNERAEVGLLSHNVIVRSDDSILNTSSPAGSAGFGGHMMAMAGSRVRIENTEFRDMGQRSVFGRYPIHFHQVAGGGQGSYVKNSSIWRTHNRCMVIHGTHLLLLEKNVMYNSTGHCVYFEEGSEQANQVKNNLVAYVKPLKGTARLIPTDDRPAAYWMTRPGNTLTGNVASEAHFGFWYAFPEKPIPFGRAGQNLTWMDSIYPRQEKMGPFLDNVAHATSQGLFVDGGIASVLCEASASRSTCNNHSNLTTMKDAGAVSYVPRQIAGKPINTNTQDPNVNLPVVARFTNFTAYKNSDRGVWLRGQYHELFNAKLADNKVGAIFASSRSYMTGGLVVGHSINTLGNNASLEPRGGFHFYDGHVGVRGTTFKNFTTPQSGALGYLRHTSFSIQAQNYTQGLTFVNSNRVYLDTPPAPVFSSTNEDSKDGYRGAVFYDHDGSVTGTAGRSVTANHPFLADSKCTLRTDWNSYVCDNTYLNLVLNTMDNSEISTPAAPMVVQRSDGPSINLWGSPNGVGIPNTYYFTRLIASPASAPSPVYTHQVKFGTSTIPSKYLAYLTIDGLPTDSNFININPVAGTVGAWTEVILPATGNVYVYRNHYFAQNSGNGIQKVNTLNELYQTNRGATYYQDEKGVHVLYNFTDPAKSRYQSFHICTVKGCP